MNNADIPPGWIVNFALESGHIDANLTPPQSIGDLLDEPSKTQLNSFRLGFPAREDAIKALAFRYEFELKDAAFMRRAHEQGGEISAKLQSYLAKKDAYLQAVGEILKTL